MAICWIGIGANIGDARAAFDAAWRELGQHPNVQLQCRSGIYLTSPVGADAGGVFSNAVFSLQTDLSPINLLNQLQSIETGLGRTHEVRWGPRPLDLDLLYVEDLVLNELRLTLPHPAAWYRRFVLDPMLEVAPSLRHPILNQTVCEIHRRLVERPFVIGCHETLLRSGVVNPRSIQNRYLEVQIVSCESPVELTVCLRLNENDPAGLCRDNVPVANLTMSPGDIPQRLVDFLTAVLDQPRRDCDW